MSKVETADNLENLSNVDLRARCIEYGLPNVTITDTSRKLLTRRLRAAMDGCCNANANPAAKGKSRRDLENLNNVDLRARCVEYGLPNVPITDTSRQLLIRRLRAVMDGCGDANARPPAKKKSRCETINVVAKVVEPATYTSQKKGRTVSRRTIGGAETVPNYTTQHVTSSQTTRHYTTSGAFNKTPIDYTRSTNLGYRTHVSECLHSAENSEDNADEDDENLDVPYLSDFARRLSRLKAEPLIDSFGSGSLKKDISHFRESQRYYTTSIGGRRGISKNDSLGDSFRQFWVAIDRKYGLRKYLAVIAIVLVVIFVYIFFLQQK